MDEDRDVYDVTLGPSRHSTYVDQRKLKMGDRVLDPSSSMDTFSDINYDEDEFDAEREFSARLSGSIVMLELSNRVQEYEVADAPAEVLSEEEQLGLIQSYRKKKFYLLVAMLGFSCLLVGTITALHLAGNPFFRAGPLQYYELDDNSTEAQEIGTIDQEIANCVMPFYGRLCDKLYVDAIGATTYLVLQLFYGVYASIVFFLFAVTFQHIRQKTNVLKHISFLGMIASMVCGFNSYDPLCWKGYLDCSLVEALQQLVLTIVLVVIAMLSYEWMKIDQLKTDPAIIKRRRNVKIALILVIIAGITTGKEIQPSHNALWCIALLICQVFFFIQLTIQGFVSFWRLLIRMESLQVARLLSFRDQVQKRIRILSYICVFAVLTAAISANFIFLATQIQFHLPHYVVRPPLKLVLLFINCMNMLLAQLFMISFAGFLWKSSGVTEEKKQLFSNGATTRDSTELHESERQTELADLDYYTDRYTNDVVVLGYNPNTDTENNLVRSIDSKIVA